MPPPPPPASLFPLILNLLKDGRQDFQIPRDFPYRPPAILQQVQDERMGGQPVQDERENGNRFQDERMGAAGKISRHK